MDNRPVWTHTQFVKFFKKSPRRAYEYRRDALWCEIPNEYLTEEEKNTKTEEKKVEETQKVEFTRADLIEKLEKAGITYVKTSKDDTLLKKCIENNLLN